MLFLQMYCVRVCRDDISISSSYIFTFPNMGSYSIFTIALVLFSLGIAIALALTMKESTNFVDTKKIKKRVYLPFIVCIEQKRIINN